jgi:UDP-N-acetylglucosamine 4,6-dehydratase/5-epimerase
MDMKEILVTGGAGSIGSNLVYKLLEDSNTKRVVALDNNEYALACLASTCKDDKRLQLAVGDVRDKSRTIELLDGIDTIIHTAALKRVETAEYNVVESIKTNVFGTINLVEATHQSGVKKLLLISSDKAVPAGDMALYGSTKFLQERIVMSARHPPTCSIARFGNVIGTRGDVCEIWKKQKANGEQITITNAKMRRFFWTMREAIDFVMMCLSKMQGKEIFVPDIKEYNIVDFAKKIVGEGTQFKEIGLREGEVFLHELISPQERLRAKREDWGWLIPN